MKNKGNKRKRRREEKCGKSGNVLEERDRYLSQVVEVAKTRNLTVGPAKGEIK